MSTTVRTSTHKKSAVHSSTSLSPEATTAPAISPETAETSAASPPVTPRKPTSAFTTKLIAQIDAIEAGLDLDIVIDPNDSDQAKGASRVTDAAIGLASEIVAAAPERFPEFSGIAPGAAYVEDMTPVANRVGVLLSHLQKSLRNKRTPAALQTLALYAVVKGLGRVVENETMREKVLELKAEISPKPKNPKPKVTKGEKAVKQQAKAVSKRVKKALGVLAANGVALPAAAAAPADPVVANGATAAAAAVVPAATPAK